MAKKSTDAKETRCGMVAVIGAPNAGKSTLTNLMVGSKVSIVTPKVQTTRVRVRGVAAQGKTQLIFIDTPGIFSAKGAFEKKLVQEAWAGAADGDVILLLIDARKGLDEETQAVLEGMKQYAKKPVAVAINKIDLVDKPFLLKLATVLSGYPEIQQIFMISALKNDGVKDVKKWLAAQMPLSPWLYPDDHLSDVSMRELAAEITREKLFLLLRQELPYSLTVETEKWEEKENGAIVISQAILVEREGQKKIVIGAKGETLKKVGMSARRELEKMLDTRIHLELFVKVEEKWKDR